MSKKAQILLILSTLFTLNLIGQANYSNLEFVQNKGQWDTSVTFKGNLSNGAFFLRKTGFTVLQYHSEDMDRIALEIHGHDKNGKTKPVRPTRSGGSNPSASDDISPSDSFMVRSHVYTMDFLNMNPNARQEAGKPEQGYNNYFIGNDSTKWASNCGIFHEIIYKDIYPGIDVKYYTESGSLKYEFIVHPGADPSQIAMKFNGADKLSLRNGELIIGTSVGEVKELSPYTYQSLAEGRKKIDVRYKIEKNNVVRFTIKDYATDQLLIIDPTLVFASLTGSLSDNWGYTATYGPDGSFFSGGIVFGGGFKYSPGAFQTNFGNGSFNMGIMKLSPDGSRRIYATYLGGNGEDQPHSLFCDPQGNLVIAGRTSSELFPRETFFGTRGKKGDMDIVTVKLNADGSNIIGCVRIGGSGIDGRNTNDSHTQGPAGLVNNYGDDARSEVILDGAANIYVASCTMSSDFYTTANAVQKTYNGSQDAVLIKLNPNCSSVLYSSYLGGKGFDAGFVLALNPSNNDVYMAGATTSTDFPGNMTNSIQPVFTPGGRTEGFIAVFSNDGSILRQTTYLGTAGLDFIYGIQFDRNSFPYVMGTTTGDWPVVNAAYSITKSKQFVAKLKKDLSGFVYSTVFGTANSSAPNISPVAFLVDRCENVYVSGWGKDIGGAFTQVGPRGMPISSDAIQTTTDNQDFYFIVIKKDAASLLYGTYYGQNGPLGEHVDGGTSRYDQQGVIYQAICANCSGGGSKSRWPVTPGAWCCSSGYAPSSGSGCNLGMLKIAFNFAGVGSAVRAFINGSLDSTGCAPATVTFRDTVRNAKTYEWSFGDNSPDEITTTSTNTHTFNNVGTYRVRLISVDSTTCNIRDTSYVNIIVKNNRANLAWTFQKIDCLSMDYTFINQSTAPLNLPFTNTSFIWDFGDGTRIDPSGPGNVNHTFAAPGTYPVRLVLTDTSYCNAPDSLPVMLRVSPLVRAQFETPASECSPYTAFFNNTSLGGQTFVWNFGDPASGAANTSTDINPTHFYANPGTYQVSLQATDPASCNVVHDTTMQIVLNPAPTASFTYTPVEPIENTPNTFTNNSSLDAVRFKWIFGDGDSLETASRAPIDHQYNETFTYTACLVAFNQFGCTDTTCQLVKVIVSPKLDVPNAFTPLGPEPASKIFVRGFAIGKIKFTIYNRLGQKVFETTDRTQGWDGRFKGVVQPMDVYAYTLEVQFTDGTHATKKGDITLIR